ncbi:MAG: hypothetical protein ABSE40_15285 [Candidatus Sulfotelmatobacter sp.]|jgi:hypothetical protein
MARFSWFRSRALLLLAVAATFACGSNRKLQSVSLTPAAADAKNFPHGQVPFAATGTFSKPPSPAQLTSNDVLWCYGGLTNVAGPTPGLCVGNIAQFATVDQNGVAQCSPSFQGTVYILAGTASGPAMPNVGPRLKIFGSAELTCP